MEQINLAQAREALTAAVATQGPDFVYNPGDAGSCFYRPLTVGETVQTSFSGPVTVAEGDPRTKTGCLVGVALDILGVDYDHTAQVSSMRITDFTFTDAASYYLRIAQMHQDQGGTWGQALIEADNAAPRLLRENPEAQ